MLDPVPVVGARLTLERLLVGVQHHLDAAIADGVHRHLEAGVVGLPDVLLELLPGHHRQPVVVRPRVVEEGPADGGGTPDEAAVDKELDRPDAEPVVAEALLDPERDQVGQQVLADHQRGAQLEDAPLNCPLVGLDLER
ncbi:hypothetical protein HRbin26_01915 [bacterium HR26]|nr:hypothetical protein HRbin26_01915 [bacterium HR26]